MFSWRRIIVFWRAALIWWQKKGHPMLLRFEIFSFKLIGELFLMSLFFFSAGIIRCQQRRWRFTLRRQGRLFLCAIWWDQMRLCRFACGPCAAYWQQQRFSKHVGYPNLLPSKLTGKIMFSTMFPVIFSARISWKKEWVKIEVRIGAQKNGLFS